MLRPRPEGEFRTVFVDLGVSRLLSDEAVDDGDQLTEITTADRCVGTMEYMAPEQILSSRSAKPAVDVYAVGAILFPCLAGHNVFGDLGGVELARKKPASRPLRSARAEAISWREASKRSWRARSPRLRTIASRAPRSSSRSSRTCATPPAEPVACDRRCVSSSLRPPVRRHLPRRPRRPGESFCREACRSTVPSLQSSFSGLAPCSARSRHDEGRRCLGPGSMPTSAVWSDAASRAPPLAACEASSCRSRVQTRTRPRRTAKRPRIDARAVASGPAVPGLRRARVLIGR